MHLKIELLEKLSELRRQRILTEEEFQHQKTEVMSDASSESVVSYEQSSILELERAFEFSALDHSEAAYDVDDAAPDFAERAWSKVGEWSIYLAGGVVAVVASSFLGFSSPYVRWAIMSDDQLKRELLTSTAETGQKVYACMQANGDCDDAFEATRETYTLASKLCAKNPDGNACSLKDMAAREQHMVGFWTENIKKLGHDLDQSVLNSL